MFFEKKNEIFISFLYVVIKFCGYSHTNDWKCLDDETAKYSKRKLCSEMLKNIIDLGVFLKMTTDTSKMDKSSLKNNDVKKNDFGAII